jgi:hypothetical protein
VDYFTLVLSFASLSWILLFAKVSALMPSSMSAKEADLATHTPASYTDPQGPYGKKLSRMDEQMDAKFDADNKHFVLS